KWSRSESLLRTSGGNMDFVFSALTLIAVIAYFFLRLYFP
ncbi:MAG: hypothetical protein RL145_1482, partial [Pseudomonadota bacterium]